MSEGKMVCLLVLGCLLAIGLFFLGWFCLACLDVTYGDGYRDGYVQKLSDRGLIWVTCEGELSMPGFRLEQGTGGVWSFSCPDKNIAEQLRNLRPMTMVRLRYRQVLVSKWWVSSTDYLVTGVEVLR